MLPHLVQLTLSLLRTLWSQIQCGFFVNEDAAFWMWLHWVVFGRSSSIVRLSSSFIGYTRLLYRSFCYFVFSLSLSNGPNIRWHKRTLLHLMSWSEIDGTVLEVTINGTELYLDHALIRRLLVPSGNFLKLFSKLMSLLVWATVFQRKDFLDEEEDKLEPRRSCILIVGVFSPRRVDVFCLYWS